MCPVIDYPASCENRAVIFLHTKKTLVLQTFIMNYAWFMAKL
jgi:hypothetical protein